MSELDKLAQAVTERRPIRHSPIPLIRIGPPRSFWIVVIVGILILAGLAVRLFENTGPKPLTAAPPAVRLYVEDGQVVLENRDHRIVGCAKLEINDRFSYPSFMVAPGHDARIGVLLFADAKGERFNPLRFLAKKIVAHVKTADGGDDYLVLSR